MARKRGNSNLVRTCSQTQSTMKLNQKLNEHSQMPLNTGCLHGEKISMLKMGRVLARRGRIFGNLQYFSSMLCKSRLVTVVAYKLERQWVWKTNCGNLRGSCPDHNRLTTIRTSVKESIQMHFKVVVRNFHALNASR